MTHGLVRGDVRIVEDGRVDGIVGGSLTVAAGARVAVGGMVRGALIVEPGATVEVTGMIGGGIDNRGGSVSVKGLVRG